jgi:hypothetical protein
MITGHPRISIYPGSSMGQSSRNWLKGVDNRPPIFIPCTLNIVQGPPIQYWSSASNPIGLLIRSDERAIVLFLDKPEDPLDIFDVIALFRASFYSPKPEI